MENLVLGHCRLTRKIGEGGMGVVWLARHETLDKDVAVKVLPAGFASEPEAVQRFLREARSAARLEHPNVVQVLDAGSADGTHFIVMQFIDGTDLQKVLKKKGKLEVADALAVAKRVALALAAAHKMGIVHRDIKPANILLAKQGRIMVTDFGLARDMKGGTSLTNSMDVMGTPQYLSPEQARGEELDGRSDLYSLGGTLYTLLTGKPPFTGASPVSIAVKHASDDQMPEPVRKHVPEIPADVEALVEKMMAKKAAARFQTGDEVAAAIDRIKGGPATMVTVSQDKVLTPQKRRRLIMTGVGAGLGGLFLLIFLLGVLGPGKAEREFRSAGQVATDAERLVRYRAVDKNFPDTEWSERSRKAVAEMLDHQLLQVRALSADGRTPFRDISARLDALRGQYPEGVKAVDKLQVELDRARALARTKDFAEALKTHRPLDKGGDKGDKFKDFASPEAIRKMGEGGVANYARFVFFLLSEVGGRPEEIDILSDGVVVHDRKEATVPVKAVLHKVQTKERSTHKFIVQWLWQEGDWYLGEKAIVEEK
jgi:predicted Ser/Thr protein kinase